MLNSIVFKFARPIHSRLRSSRSRLAAGIMQPSPSMSLLDLGGSPGFGGEFDSLRALVGQIVVANLDPKTNSALVAPNVTVAVADGCNLPYPDQSFDWVFSNAVLEHVGGKDKQKQFAREMQRVARVGYFLSTPNRAFFLDPHTYLPYYHLLPESLQRVAVRLSVGHMQTWRPLRLVSARQLREMFPAAQVASVGPLGFNLIAYGRRAA
jgi:ubiquinone/menaquinone biosynthesis C-methylase UbiE